MTRTITVTCPAALHPLLSFTPEPGAKPPEHWFNVEGGVGRIVPTPTVYKCPTCGARVQVRFWGDWQHEARVLGTHTIDAAGSTPVVREEAQDPPEGRIRDGHGLGR